MEHSDLALLEKMKGNEDAMRSHLLTAYELETKAAHALLNNLEAEPARSVLFRSAATLAHDCGLFDEAAKLIYKALAGNPPAEIAQELDDLLGQVTFRRHLDLRGVKLAHDEIQMAMTGKSVGFGMAATDIFLARVRSTENLVYRTAERKQGEPYRDGGRRNKQLTQDVELYMSVPRAACFAVTFRVGEALQKSLPGLSRGEEVIDEFLDCLQLYSQGEEKELRRRIPDDAYYRNFVSLVRTLQPDGEKVDMVGFTTVRRGEPKQVALTQFANNPTTFSPSEALSDAIESADGETVALRGQLLIANATKKSDKQSGIIEIVTEGNVRVKLVVPPGIMSDIVKPLWELEVEAIGTRKGKQIHLMQIREAT